MRLNGSVYLAKHKILSVIMECIEQIKNADYAKVSFYW